ncbi:Gid11p NDAI_0G02380 [Naumovozyma dairenensis CBS 421]|uniref:DUF2415 domain-containing protein n=1 Tax=Naumovozyma dairenensis (strain ATCC 10597 / BCRC 20456 / CBS 421 / NBRC 0211 / NRRL Y-12639) TaxID=1071378 RepID=G0WE02_NAUDC|nr:hypothetical protein NDAI_0G02380 [Naumovozyma dairenensis CBS 421]CCD26013.2 hypothetical protein NDAI_0G02380 [Naumovozyma dairenensis CBS 421]
MPGLELYDAKVTINHWQLRDCVKPCSTNPNKLYYIFDHSIRSLDTAMSNDVLLKKQHYNYHYPSSSRKYDKKTSSLLRKNNGSVAPSKKLVEFNFKPRCFTELNGLTVCGGLIGSDDRGFPTNWNRLSAHNGDNDSVDPTTTTRPYLSSPADPIKLASHGALADSTNYSNPNIWKGIINVYNEHTGKAKSLILGQFINNCVTLFNTSNNNYDLYTCNNDGHLYQCTINNRGVELIRRYSDLKFPLNNASMSHDGQTMVVSGDSNKFALYQKDQLNNKFSLNGKAALSSGNALSNWGNQEIVNRMPRYENVNDTTLDNMNDTTTVNNNNTTNNIFDAPSGDHGFYNCFSENDMKFATLFQNGICLIYDARYTNSPLATIKSTRPNSHTGAFRVCRFSYGLDDLLFISEHQGRVHVVDTRNFENHQVIVIPDKLNMDDDLNTNTTPTLSSNFLNGDPVSLNQYLQIPSGSVNRHDLLSNNVSSISNASRHCYDRSTRNSTSENEPWITPAGSVPLECLEPQIFPFPKIIDKFSNHELNQIDYNTISSRLVDSNNNNFIGGGTSQMNHDNEMDFQPRARRRSSFRIRRVSTSSNRSEESEDIDPVISQHRRRHFNRQQYLNALNSQVVVDEDEDQDGEDNSMNTTRHTRHNVTGLLDDDDEETNNYAVFDNDDLYDAYNDINSTNIPRTRNNVILNYSNNDYTEENNISGIDWVQDNSGSSLVIGTDYGIMKWNINSWARRSFSSYEFC